MAKSSLWLASQAGRCREVEASLSSGSFYQGALQDALWIAAANDHAGVVDILLRAGAGFDSCDNHAIPMHTALRHDSVDALRTLVEAKAAVNSLTFSTRHTIVAAIHGATKCLHVLILAKADVTLKDSNEQTPLVVAAVWGWVDIVHLLVQAKADIDAYSNGSTAVLAAARRGNVAVVDLLIRAKADVTLKDSNKQTPLVVAAVWGWVDIVHLLVQAKADIDAYSNGSTAVLAAARRGNVAVVDLLIRAKADATRCNSHTTRSALWAAVAGGHAAVARCLLAHVPALAAVATQQHTFYAGKRIAAGSTPLDVALLLGHDDVVSLLVAAASNH